MKTEEIIKRYSHFDNDVLEIVLCCIEQEINDFITAYIEMKKHNLKLWKEEKK
jgi:hypothetical protein